MVSGEENKFRN